ncbi:PaaI family thioesterase [Haloplanus sp. GCM10025708]|uniref:PaaI family thioesterase n=1 Tax=Haloferacaceae TaxID=1644056 RepID=UPI00360A647B
MDVQTHSEISERYVGTPERVEDGLAVVSLATTAEMRADETGLVHGGFVFGAADYAAMLAVNESTVVLAGADVEFPAPAETGDELRARAEIAQREDRRVDVDCAVTAGETTVMAGSFDCVVPDRHVLE